MVAVWKIECSNGGGWRMRHTDGYNGFYADVCVLVVFVLVQVGGHCGDGSDDGCQFT